MNIYNKIICFFAAVMVCSGLFAQGDFAPEYVKVTNERAQKIVDELELEDRAKERELRDIIAGQYRSLSSLQDERDEKIDELKNSDFSEKKQKKKIEKLEKKTERKIQKLHRSYVKNLKARLSDTQVEIVKDGMTYGVMPNTYNAYLDMLPNLSKEQKDTIYNYLKVAREKAMDGGSSKEKHAWFGKYKGKINNYLSKKGYDLNKASKEWHKRLKERKERISEN